GQSSPFTGLLAGQVVMEGFMHWRVRPWLRRLLTRLIAIVPAILIIAMRGDGSVTDLLILSQVVLAMQLPLAMFPLLHVTSSRKWMGRHRSGWGLLVAGWASCLLITAADLYGLPSPLQEAGGVIIGHCPPAPRSQGTARNPRVVPRPPGQYRGEGYTPAPPRGSRPCPHAPPSCSATCAGSCPDLVPTRPPTP